MVEEIIVRVEDEGGGWFVVAGGFGGGSCGGWGCDFVGVLESISNSGG